jgi:hypothetical protein
MRWDLVQAFKRILLVLVATAVMASVILVKIVPVSLESSEPPPVNSPIYPPIET